MEGIRNTFYMANFRLGENVTITARINGTVLNAKGRPVGQRVQLSNGVGLIMKTSLPQGSDIELECTITGALADRNGNLKAIKCQLSDGQLVVIDQKFLSHGKAKEQASPEAKPQKAKD